MTTTSDHTDGEEIITMADRQEGALHELDVARREAAPDTFGVIMTALAYLVANTPPMPEPGSLSGPLSEPCDDPCCCPRCGESDGNGGICDEYVPGGFCSTHGEVGASATPTGTIRVEGVKLEAGHTYTLTNQAPAPGNRLVSAERFTAASIVRNDGTVHVVDDIEPGPCVTEVGMGEWGWCCLVTVHGEPIIKVKESYLEISPSDARLLAADLLSAAARAERQQ